MSESGRVFCDRSSGLQAAQQIEELVAANRWAVTCFLSSDSTKLMQIVQDMRVERAKQIPLLTSNSPVSSIKVSLSASKETKCCKKRTMKQEIT